MSEIGPHQLRARIEAVQNQLAECEEEIERLPRRIDDRKHVLAELQAHLDWWNKPGPKPTETRVIN